MLNGRLVLAKIENYKRPVKTRQLAARLGVDRPTLTETLNKLKKAKKIKWVSSMKEDEPCGWLPC